MKNEQQMLIEFEKAYYDTRNTPRALYGIGCNTLYLLENLIGYNIVCLMDSATEGQTLNGYKICSKQDVLGKVDEIVIIAYFLSSEIIYNRIKDLEHNEILIKSYYGKLLSDIFIKRKYEESQLYSKINKVDIVSFDMFSTLVNRKVLLPQDIFELVEIKLNERDINIPFKKNRILAEQHAYSKFKSATNYEDIYVLLEDILNIDKKLLNLIKQLEFETELEYIVPRKSAVEYFKFCLNNNKKVYIVSDMYLNKTYLKQILDKCDIHGYIELIASSNYEATKSNGMLYEILKSKVNTDNILHIGDNYYDDILMGEKQELETFYFISYIDMMKESLFNNLLNSVKSIDNSLLLGEFFSDYFDNPFI